MFSDEQIDTITELIESNGPIGVNDVRKALNMPLSTAQKYLSKQEVFKKNAQKKWDLADNVVEQEVIATSNGVDSMLKGQLDGIANMSQLLIANVNAVMSILSTHKPQSPPVAAKAPKFNKDVKEYTDFVELMLKIVKSKLSELPEDYRELLTNVDWYKLTMNKGSLFVQDTIAAEIANLLTPTHNEMDNDVLMVLESYQK